MIHNLGSGTYHNTWDPELTQFNLNVNTFLNILSGHIHKIFPIRKPTAIFQRSIYMKFLRYLGQNAKPSDRGLLFCFSAIICTVS